MPSTTPRLLLIMCLACAVTPPKVSAECAPRETTCAYVAKADLIFIAEVLEATFVPTLDAQGRSLPNGTVHYRFNVLEGLKGIEAGEFRAQFYFGGGNDLNEFKAGSRYLIFANRAATGIYLSGCSLTRDIAKTDERGWLPKVRTELDLCLKKR